MPSYAEQPIEVMNTVTSSTSVTPGTLTPVDATTGPVTITLPAPVSANNGARLVVTKKDSSANAITISGSIMGVSPATVSLTGTNEIIGLVADSNGSWWPVWGNKAKSWLDATYVRGSIRISSGATAPTSPAVGDLWAGPA